MVWPVPPEVAHQLVEVAGAVRQPHLLPVLDVIVDGQRVGLISGGRPWGGCPTCWTGGVR